MLLLAVNELSTRRVALEHLGGDGINASVKSNGPSRHLHQVRTHTVTNQHHQKSGKRGPLLAHFH